MAQVSKYPISKEVYDRCWELFAKTLVGIKTSNDAQQIIEDLLTPIERIMLIKRLAIAVLLTQNYEYREITKLLRVSFPTISMVNRSLQFGNDGYKKAIAKILKDEKLQEFFNNTLQKIVALPATGGKGSGVWRYLKKELENKSKDRNPF